MRAARPPRAPLTPPQVPLQRPQQPHPHAAAEIRRTPPAPPPRARPRCSRRRQYSKAADPRQPWAAGVAALLARAPLDSTDVTVLALDAATALVEEFRLHRFVLAARSPFFRRALAHAPDAVRLDNGVDARAFRAAVAFMYLAPPADVGGADVARAARVLELPALAAAGAGDAAQDQIGAAQDQLDAWFCEHVRGGRVAAGARVAQRNAGHADVLLGGFPAHRGMLRSDYFTTMFTSRFREARRPRAGEPLPGVGVDAAPEVLELVLSFLYSERTAIPPARALELLYAADMMMLERLKLKCAHVICAAGESAALPFAVYDVVRAGWECRVRRLEEFGAKYIADRLEVFLPDPELAELVAESAERITERQETDTIELVDDIRYYLGVRFRQRIGKADPFLEEEEELPEEGEEEDGAPQDPEKKGEAKANGKSTTKKDMDTFFERQEKIQNELLGGIDDLLGECLASVCLFALLTCFKKPSGLKLRRIASGLLPKRFKMHMFRFTRLRMPGYPA